MDERRMREGGNLFLHDMTESEGDVRCPLTQDYFSSNFDTHSNWKDCTILVYLSIFVFDPFGESSQIIP